MAHSNNSIITGKLQGSLGKELVFREWEGKTLVAKSPRSRTGDPTQAQAEIQEKFGGPKMLIRARQRLTPLR